ncbi:hypothetical protein VXE65_19695 [Mycolicibacterium conceptionense]
MADRQHARDLERGDHINISATIASALSATDERFYFDNLDSDGDGLLDATVEGVTTSQRCTTVYTSNGAFSVPDDWFVNVVGSANNY